MVFAEFDEIVGGEVEFLGNFFQGQIRHLYFIEEAFLFLLSEPFAGCCMECDLEFPVEGGTRESALFYQFVDVLTAGVELHDFGFEIEIVVQNGIE